MTYPLPTSPSSLSEPPPQLTAEQLKTPTSILYASTSPNPHHYGPFAHERAQLDWSYHKIPTKERHQLQDEIIEAVLRKVSREVIDCETRGKESHPDRGTPDYTKRDRPLALFTAGGMGAGKGHTLKELLRAGTIRLPKDFVWVDPDALARSLPEREQYLRADPTTASKMLHPEASLLQEILSGVAKTQRRSLVIDGSLSDCGWFGKLMKRYREEDGYDCEILFVSAPEEKMLERAARRAKITGRYTDPQSIRYSRLKSPECVSRLSTPSHVSRVRFINNDSDHAAPQIMYDSARDPDWNEQEEELGRGKVDVKGFVEGRCLQGEDGKVKRVPGVEEGDGAEEDCKSCDEDGTPRRKAAM
ncbi:zeta toxin-domain-containing protein [Leucosporidium creatinivorum]|uniref:Zeta toxin-domain-containing protein n=1 Tax=Leucosporidium creatinivorum TaxID=106004 RepID=A0A1Y2ESE8_9BASI|nr:zeta toxin-domain-containing protein [Leucosporidium creatinivorum]